MSWLDGTRARLRLLFARRATESRMEEEFRFHLEMETARLVREHGLAPEEARRRAFVAFGGVERHKEELRDGRGLAWLGGLSLDLKLGARMLVKYPGLTLVGLLGLAVAVAVGAVAFAGIGTIVDGSLPFDEGDRIVAIQNLDVRDGDEGRRTHLHDLAVWRDALTTVVDLGAWRTIDRNLVTADGQSAPRRIAEMSASGFRLARVRPLLGRYLHEEDERAGAPPVVVIGYDVWQRRFGGRRDAVGQTVLLGDRRHVVIGVMPEGFAFPVNNQLWTPLRLDLAHYAAADVPPVDVFGRLAPTATLADAQQQATAIGRRLAAADPETHEHILTRVLPYTRTFIDSPELVWAFHLAQVLVSLVLVVIGTNVAILVYARTTTRLGEIAMRTALGASRARIVAQLFAEALVLSAAAAVLGLAGAAAALRQMDALLARMGGEQLPFWIHFGITPGVIAYVAGLAVLASVIIGVVPALKATRARMHASLQQLGSGGAAMRLGRTWTFLIVAQVAVGVMALQFALYGVGQLVRAAWIEPAFASEQFLTATIFLDQPERSAERLAAQRSVAGKLATLGAARGGAPDDDAAFAQRFADRRTELVRRLLAEPAVRAVTLASAVPGSEPGLNIEIDTATTPTMGAAPPTSSLLTRGVRAGRVEPAFFEAFDVPLLAGRRFEAGDVADSSRTTAVIVNRSFVRTFLDGRNPLGRRLRTAREGERPPAAWEEIVGVVADFPYPTDASNPASRIYRPLPPASARPVVLAVRVRGEPPATFTNRLRALAVSVDPMLRLERVTALEATLRDSMTASRLLALTLTLVTLSAVLLSTAGIYALMSFTVTRRRREIGIRSALGAAGRRVVVSVLSRALGQIALGIALGVATMGLLVSPLLGEAMDGRDVLRLLAVAALMALVALAAAVGPTRRALRIQPTEALRTDT